MCPEQRPDSPAQASAALRDRPALARHAQLEKEIGEVYAILADTFRDWPELAAFWTRMALEEGEHSVLVQALYDGSVPGVAQKTPIEFPARVVASLEARVQDVKQRAQAEVSVDEALRLTWDLEHSEVNAFYEMILNASNLVELGLPTTFDPEGTAHLRLLRGMIEKFATDPDLRRAAGV
ncbi:MAG: hypothetical protein AB7G75_17100 [Candidatus Binatia bacterium]